MSVASSPTKKPGCPLCGAEIHRAGATKCWLCNEPLPAELVAAASPRYAQAPPLARLAEVPRTRRDNPAWAVFGILATLIVIGLVKDAPGILLVLFVLALPALIRALVGWSRRRARGEPTSPLAMVGIFFTSLGMVVLIGLCAVAAFYAVCFAVCLGGAALTGGRRGSEEFLIFASIGAGSVIALTVVIVLFYFLWFRRRKGT